MKIARKPFGSAAGLVVVGLTGKKNGPGKGELQKLSDRLDWSISKALKQLGVDDKDGTHILEVHGDKNIRAVAVIRESKKGNSNLPADQYRRAGAKIFKAAKRLSIKEISIASSIASSPTAHALRALIEGMTLSDYSFDTYRSKEKGKKSTNAISIALLGATAASMRSLPSIGQTAQGVFLTRDLVSTPAADCTPSSLCSQARALAKSPNITTKIFTGRQLEAKKMNGILSVGRASKQKPAFITLTYNPRKKIKRNTPTIGLLGKGVTFDAGGLSIKPGSGMETMKCDMAGAATVLGVFKALSLLKPAIRVKGYIPTAENMIDGNALRPGDVIKMMSGKTVEVLNTDAEGRLILADALHYADSDGCDQLIDLATLTGSIVVALGTDYAGVFTEDEKMRKGILESAAETGERMWAMPLVEEYKDLLKSNVADIKNIGSRWGGSITAGLFLQHFVKKTPWTHIDIAGPAFYEREDGYTPKGGTGFGVRTLVNYLERIS